MEQYSGSSILDPELVVTPAIDRTVRGATRWAKFISIVCIIFLVILLAIGFFGSALIASMFEAQLPAGSASFMGTVAIVMVLFVAAIVGVLIYFLLRFATLTRKGIAMQNQAMFNDGLSALKIYFTIYGVLTIIGIFFTAIGLLASL